MIRTRSVKPQWRDGMWKVRVTDPRPDAVPKRPWVPLEGIPVSDPDRAQRKADLIVEIVRANGVVAMTAGETVGQYMGRWFAARERRMDVEYVKAERGKYTLHFAEALDHLPMSGVTSDHGRSLVARLDAAVERGEMKWKTAANLWSIPSKAFKDAASSKDNALRVLTVNPFAGVTGPEQGQRTAKQYLYPEELLTLVSCEAVPLWRRRLYAFAIYSYVRAGELAALRWADVDTKRGHVTIHTSVTRHGKRGDVAAKREAGGDGTKTEASRRYVLEIPILSVLAAMADEAAEPSGLIFTKLPPYNGRDGQAAVFRSDLVRAGVKRPALHATTKTRKQITFHDLRATAITWAAIRGDSPIKIMARSGHETLDVLMQYVREAEAIREGFGEVFPELPEALLGSKSERPANVPNVPKRGKKADRTASPRGFEWRAKNRRSRANDGSGRVAPDRRSSRRVEPRGPEADLAESIRLAAKAGQWDVVAQLGRQLAAMQSGGPALRLVEDNTRTKRGAS